MPFELFVATRYLRAKRRQAVIGVITAISVIGVAAGVASLIIALAINNGFRSDMQKRLLGSMAHVQLERVEADGIRDWPDLLSRVEHLPHVTAASPAVYGQVLISRGARAQGALVKGVIPSKEVKVSDLLQNVKWGSDEPIAEAQKAAEERRAAPDVSADFSGDNSASGSTTSSADAMESVQKRIDAMPPIILGKDLADSLGANVGSVVLVTSPQKELTPFGIVPGYIRFKVVGIFQTGFYDNDAGWAITDLADVQKLLGIGDIATVIEFKVDDIYRAKEIGDEIEKVAGKGFMTTNWMEQNRALFRALRLEKVVTFITIGLIVFVAALNILISLIMMVMEKTKDIAVLMSLGTRKRQVRHIFIAQGVLIGVLGTAIGLVIGYVLAWGLGHYHWISLSPEVYSIDYVPSAPRLIDGMTVAVVAIAISFIATIYPSWSASRVLPAEALRYE
jgi:lipoprotein-releasing system permease protein